MRSVNPLQSSSNKGEAHERKHIRRKQPYSTPAVRLLDRLSIINGHAILQHYGPNPVQVLYKGNMTRIRWTRILAWSKNQRLQLNHSIYENNRHQHKHTVWGSKNRCSLVLVAQMTMSSGRRVLSATWWTYGAYCSTCRDNVEIYRKRMLDQKAHGCMKSLLNRRDWYCKGTSIIQQSAMTADSNVITFVYCTIFLTDSIVSFGCWLKISLVPHSKSRSVIQCKSLYSVETSVNTKSVLILQVERCIYTQWPIAVFPLFPFSYALFLSHLSPQTIYLILLLGFSSKGSSYILIFGDDIQIHDLGSSYISILGEDIQIHRVRASLPRIPPSSYDRPA